MNFRGHRRIQFTARRASGRRPSAPRIDRWGGAVTELTVCLPVIVLLVFASIEACSMIFLRQALSATAYEGVRVAIRENATNTQVIARCNEVLAGRKVSGATPTIDVADVSTILPGDPIRISVTAPCDANSITPGWFFAGRNLVTSASMVKEE